jgi:hypothetical protein
MRHIRGLFYRQTAEDKVRKFNERQNRMATRMAAEAYRADVINKRRALFAQKRAQYVQKRANQEVELDNKRRLAQGITASRAMASRIEARQSAGRQAARRQAEERRQKKERGGYCKTLLNKSKEINNNLSALKQKMGTLNERKSLVSNTLNKNRCG